MYRRLGGIILVFCLGAAWADDEPALLPALSTSAVKAQTPATDEPLLLPMPRAVPRAETPPTVTDLQREAAKLRLERERLALEREKAAQAADAIGTAQADEIAKARLRLAALLTRLGKDSLEPQPQPAEPIAPPVKPGSPVPPAPKATLPPKQVLLPPVGPPAHGQPALAPGKPVDPMGLAQALFLTGDYDGALATYRTLDVNSLNRQDRGAVQYLMACCLRHLGKYDQAAALYREVVNARDDDILVDCAQWQLSALQWRRELESQLQQIRQRREALEVVP